MKKRILVISVLTSLVLTNFVTYSHATEVITPDIVLETISEEDHQEAMASLTGSDREKEEKKVQEQIRRNEQLKKIAENQPKIDKYDEVVTKYAGELLMVRSKPESGHNVIGQIKAGSEVTITGKVHGSKYVVITYENKQAFIEATEGSLTDDKWYHTYNHDWDGAKLNKSAGVVLGPNGYESYYNLNMNGIISIMRSMGYSEEEYPYWVREDGAKMLGDYIMVAADLSKYPRGSISMCSLGQCIVCDTGGFIHSTNRTFDVATAW